MEKIVLEGVELQFNDFSKKLQERLYLQDREKFEKDAACSQFEEIRKLVIENEQSSSTILDEVFKTEVKQNESPKNVKLLKEKTNFRMDNEKRKELAKSKSWQYRQIAAEDEENSSEFLNQMLKDEIEDEADSDVIEAILNNPNFKMEEKTRNVIAKSENFLHRQIAAVDEESSSEFLSQLLKNEIEGWDDFDVIRSILNNPNFKMEGKTRNILAKSENWEHRKIAAEAEGATIEFLENMYLKEKDEDIIEVIESKLLQEQKNISLSIVQKHQILKVLKEFKASKISALKCLDKILKIIG